MIWRRSPRVWVGRRAIEVRPLNLEDTLALLLILAPYLALVEMAWPQFQAALKDAHGMRPALLSALLSTLAREIDPADLTRLMVLALGLSEAEVRQMTAKEAVEALPVIDAVNDFYALVEAARGLGLRVHYGE